MLDFLLTEFIVHFERRLIMIDNWSAGAIGSLYAVYDHFVVDNPLKIENCDLQTAVQFVGWESHARHERTFSG